MTTFKIILIADDHIRVNHIKNDLTEHGFDVVACFSQEHAQGLHAEHVHADAVLLDLTNPQQHVIEYCIAHYDVPSLLFTPSTDHSGIKQAIDAGVTTYMVAALNPAQLASILMVAIAQYKKHKKLQNELKAAKTKLADRKDIDKAKVLLMQLHNLNEDTAFQLLRKNAMHQRMTMGEMARRLLDAEQLLNRQMTDK